LITVEKISRFLPHRFPFLLVDRVVDLVPGKTIVALKNVTCNEQFFQGHFPEWKIMPGVLIIEAIAEGQRPATMSPDQALIFDALGEVWSHDGWSDATYRTVIWRFGEQGAIDLVATASYYALLANVMNVTKTAVPAGPTLPALRR
jgi:hypothetical protein